MISNKDKFLKVYYNLPINLREEVVVVLEEKPITWNVAYLEIKNETKLGEKIFKKMLELEII